MITNSRNDNSTKAFAPRSVLLGSCLFMSACGGNSPAPLPTELEILSSSADAMIDRFETIPFTSPNLVPTSGTADYSGFFLGQLANTSDDLTDSISGEMVVQVNFAVSNMISGTVYRIVDDNGDAMSGKIDFSGGLLNREGDPNVDATLTFEGDGALTDINSNPINLDLVFEGDFLGADANGISGDILGRAVSGEANQAVGGVFIVERDHTD